MEENRKKLLTKFFKSFPDMPEDYKFLVANVISIKDKSDRYAIEDWPQLLSTVKYIQSPKATVTSVL